MDEKSNKISNDIYAKSKTGLWACEQDEGKPPRLYVDDVMLGLIGLEKEISPEDNYRAWNDHVDKGSYSLVHESMDIMASGKYSEVQYPWHHPNGKTMIVRCGGIRNYDYKDGIRVEGTHQDITNVSHLDEEKKKRDVQDLTLFLLSSLSEAYTALYYINADTGEYRLITRDDEFGRKVNHRLAHGDNFFEDTAKSIASVVYPDDFSKIENFTSKEKMEACFNGHDSFSIEYRIVIDNEPVWYCLKAVKINDDTGLYYALGISRIDDQRKQEIDLITTNLRSDAYKYIYDNEPSFDRFIDFYCERILNIINADCVTLRLKNGRQRVFYRDIKSQYDLKACTNCPFAKVDSEVFRQDGYLVLSDVSKGSQGVLPAKDCPAKSSCMYQIFVNDEIVGLLSICYFNEHHHFLKSETDIAKSIVDILQNCISRIDIKKSELARLKAESSNKAKSEFLFNMSHDIRTPMNAILGYTEIGLKNKDNKDKVHECLEKIKISGEYLLKLINDILEMSRIEAGKFELVNVPLNIYEVTNGVTLMSKALAITKKINFETKYGKLDNPYIYADELHTNQILVNLISNAIKYTPEGGNVEYRIEQVSKPENGIARYRFTVKDDGIGMSEEFQKHLFESFSRERSTTISKQEGAGLGLSIVKKIVDLAHGTITVNSKKNEGSTFSVELPFRVMDEKAIKEYEDEKARKISFEGNKNLHGKRVLIAEDNEMNREITVEMLEEVGIKTETAVDGNEAVKMVKEKGVDYYDFILMDIQMPIMDGYEATIIIRKMEGGQNIPIIALSANAFREDKEKSIAVGMNAHIAKPINIKELISTLQVIMTNKNESEKKGNKG